MMGGAFDPHITITIEVDLSKSQGKLISKDALAEAIMGELDDPGAISVDESEYEITSWEVSWT